MNYPRLEYKFMTDMRDRTHTQLHLLEALCERLINCICNCDSEQCKLKTDKSSIDEFPRSKLKDLPPHLEYAFLEGDDKLPVIIAKDLSVEEKVALIKVLKSHKRAIA
ncbi:hypothetical protein Tco_1254849 [Tanacetum coccineum]